MKLLHARECALSVLAIIVAVLTCERQEGDVTSAFDGTGQLTLMACARARLAPRPDLAFFGDEPAQQIILFVVDLDILISAELADLGARNVTSPAALLFIIHIHIV